MRRIRTFLLCSVLASAAALTGGLHAQGTAPLEVANAGLETPESMLHDAAADVYLVSNINGAPSVKDDNGFISRVSPDGQVAALKWIAGGRNGITLHAPKGLAIHGDTLYVSDIDCVRRFNRTTGAAAGETCIEGATFLNDVAVGSDGTVYVTDTGIRIDANGMSETGTDAVYRIAGSGPATAVIRTTDLQRPNGIVAAPDGLLVAAFGAARIFHIDANGTRHVMATLPAGQLDGLVRLADGTLLVSSWQAQAVFQQRKNQTTPIVENVPSPADIGYDSKRKRLLIPVFTENRLVMKEVP